MNSASSRTMRAADRIGIGPLSKRPTSAMQRISSAVLNQQSGGCERASRDGPLHLGADCGIVDAQKTIVCARHCLRHDLDNVLGHNADMCDVAPQVLELVNAESSRMLGNPLN